MAEHEAGMDRSGELALVFTTVAEEEDGERLVRQLLEERLIACGNLVSGIVSLFRWEAAVSREREVLVLIKAPSGMVERLFARMAELHPYEVPELIALPVESVSQAYLRWVQESTEVGA